MVKVERFLVGAVMCLGAVGVLQAQGIVDASGVTVGSYPTINAALAANETDIVVKNTGVYHEGLLLTRDVIVRGEDPNNPPVIAMEALASQPVLGPGDGIYIGGDGQSADNLDITFKNFILIPALTNSITDDAFSVSPNPGGILKVNIENVLCAPNNGSDQPLTTDVWANPDLAGAGVIRVPDDGIYLMNDQFSGFDGDIQVTLTDLRMIGVGGDAFVLYAGQNGSASITASGLAATHSGRYAAQISQENPLTITGTRENPGWIARKNAVGILCFGGGQVQFDHVVAVDNEDCGLRVDANNNVNVAISNSLFARNKFQGVVVKNAPPAAKTWSISDTTFLNNDTGNNGIANLEFTSDVTADMTANVNDCIFAGTDSEAIQNAGAANVIANNCAFVTAGPNALPSVFLGTPPTENSSVNADPEFTNIDTDPLLANSFDVGSVAYATASSTSGELNGWGDGPGSSVRDWSVY